MKDGRTHLAHKAEHAVDLETGAIVGVTVQGADQGDTTTIAETVTTTAEELEAVAVATDGHTAALLHESSLARTRPTDRILTGRCDMTLVGRARSAD